MVKYFNPNNYIIYIINKIVYLFSPTIKKWEQKYFEIYGVERLKHEPVFIIGAPRTGSTILYQTLTNQLDVLYIDNLICRFNKNLFFGFWLSHKLFKNKPHNCFGSNHGDTSRCGLHAPSECGSFWYKWLPTGRHFIDYNDITSEMVKEIRREITSIINYYDKPLVFNNNNAGMRIRLIQNAFPNAKYIITDREPFYVAQSLLKARKYFYDTYDAWWSIMPNNYNKLIKEEYFKQVVKQHYFINKQMYTDLHTLTNNDSYITITYSDFCLNKDYIVEILKSFFNYTNQRENFISNSIFESKTVSLDAELVKLIKNEIKRLDWDDYTS